MTGFITWLEHISTRTTKARAELRRSLAFPPGTYIPAYPYVEPFLRSDPSPWERNALYLTAGLWAMHWRPGQQPGRLSFAKACATHQTLSGSASTEHRFLTVLDADADQLPHRLQQMIAILKPYPLDFVLLLHGLQHWNAEDRVTQQTWAHEFYQQLRTQPLTTTPSTKETTA